MYRSCVRLLVIAASLSASACTVLQPGSYGSHPLDTRLEGEWYYECRYFLVNEALPISLEGRALYFRGQTREILEVYAGTDCNEAGHILSMRFEGTYRLGGPLQVVLDDEPVDAYRDDEVKTRVVYDILPTFVSVAGDDADCKSLVGKRGIDGSVAALAKCDITKTFRDLETRSASEKTVLRVDGCRLFNGDDEGDHDPQGYPVNLDTKFYGARPCKNEQ